MIDLKEKDLKELDRKGLTVYDIEKQLKNFQTGFPYLNIKKAATVGDGIIRIEESELEKYSGFYEQHLGGKQVVKFVPASGAATRMFKALFEFLKNTGGKEEDVKADAFIARFFDEIKNFAFYDDLDKIMQRNEGKTIKQALEMKNYRAILQNLLFEDGLNYGNLPKGLLKFHRCHNGSRTPVEEHLVEGATYAHDKDGVVQLCFTVSPEHLNFFQHHINEIKEQYEETFDVRYHVSFSKQKPATAKIAVDMDNKPLRAEDGGLVFRPGGHGTLILNLNEIDSDIIFIKNIDNVLPDKLKQQTTVYKKVIAGVLIKYQEKIVEYIKKLESGKDVSQKLLAELDEFYRKELCTLPPEDFEQYDESQKIAYFLKKLNRPIRVCGMVKNEGEPGGGPFWAENPDGTSSLQIVETTQIDPSDSEKKNMLANATHFNPVDLVCATKNHKGEKFDLLEYIDPQTGFITVKSKGGIKLKAQEAPGLWNGAMADWNTIFVEVPIETFNPVKTVNDLLKPQHQV